MQFKVPKGYKSQDVIDRRRTQIATPVPITTGRGSGPGPRPDIVSEFNPIGGRGAGAGWRRDGSYAARRVK